ncbi:putative leucine-rich repeat-containing protein DDB_G0290503 [Polyergus mexicanus]|uniref:putative leucine-rich repeat-containing protein DDB_G0290503 n=1 Tax=Polyergus mexicanus TaxID=615972 RepID=UPI0038B49B4A
MEKTIGNITPGGRPILMENPPSQEVGSMDSGESQLLQSNDPFKKSSRLLRSPSLKTSSNIINNSSATSFRMEIDNDQHEVDQHLNYYEEWKKETMIRKSLEKTVNKLQQQLNELTSELRKLKSEEVSTTPSIINNINYETDEEELAKETEWIRIKNKNKKRKLNTSLTPPQLIKKLTETPAEIKIKKTPLPPPIMLDDIPNYDKFYNIIKKDVAENDFQVKVMNKNNIKINAKNSDAYRQLVNILKTNNLSFHSYENKQIRPIRVMAKNLHHSCNEENIIADLTRQGLKVQNVVNKQSWKRKEPLDMFVLSFDSEEDISKIFQISNIMNCKVEIQSLKTNKLIPQCKKCQAYGHTQQYCNREPRCVKCAGKHYFKECKKQENELPKCVHCGENHPANYRGCMVAKEMQRLKNKNTKSINIQKSSEKINYKIISNEDKDFRKQTSQPQPKNTRKTYSQVAKGDDANINDTLKIILQKLDKQQAQFNEYNERLKRLENYTKGAIPKSKKNG